MIEILNEIANSTTLFIVGAWFGLVITIVLIILFFVKSSRDERGRSIIGKASIISTIVFPKNQIILQSKRQILLQ